MEAKTQTPMVDVNYYQSVVPLIIIIKVFMSITFASVR